MGVGEAVAGGDAVGVDDGVGVDEGVTFGESLGLADALGLGVAVPGVAVPGAAVPGAAAITRTLSPGCRMTSGCAPGTVEDAIMMGAWPTSRPMTNAATSLRGV